MTIETDLFKLIFQAEAITGLARDAETGLTDLWVSLHQADPYIDDQTAYEVEYTGYARVSVARSAAAWTVTDDRATLALPLSFPACTGGTAIAAYFAIGTAASGAGRILYRGALYPLLTITAGITPELAAGTEIRAVSTPGDWPVLRSEPRFVAHLIGASFVHSMSHEAPSGPRMAQRLAQMLGDHSITTAGVAGSSIQDFELLATNPLEPPLSLERLPDFLVIDCTGSAFVAEGRPVVIDAIGRICAAYDEHPDRARCEILASQYPSWSGSVGNPAIAQMVPDGPGWEAWRDDYAAAVIAAGARLVDAWQHWRPVMLPHPLLGGMPDYHPSDGSCKRAAAFYSYVMQTLWAARAANRISHDDAAAAAALARTRWTP